MLQGVNRHTHKCHKAFAPTSFIWCQLRIAEMPIEQRTKGRATPWSQQCHMRLALPNQFNGVIVKTQKCRDIVAPRGEPRRKRSFASVTSLSPTSLQGATPWAQIAMYFSPPPIIGDTDMTQQCLDHNSLRERSILHRSNATTKTPLPPV